VTDCGLNVFVNVSKGVCGSAKAEMDVYRCDLVMRMMKLSWYLIGWVGC
jgi:hypothetical protein